MSFDWEASKAKAFIDAMHSHSSVVHAQANSLRYLADAFNMTGNQTVADDLTAIAHHLEGSLAAMRAAYSEKQGEMLAADQAAFSKTILAALGRSA